MLAQIHVYLMNVDRFFFLPPITLSYLILSPTETFFPKLIFKFSFTYIHTYKLLFFLFELHRCYIMYFYFRLFFLRQSLIIVTHHHASLYDTQNWTQGFMHARQAFYQLSDIHSPDYSYGKTRFTGLFGYGCLILLKATKTVSDWGKIWAQDKKVVFLILLLPIKCAWELSLLLSRLSPGTCAHLFTSPPLFSYLLLIPRAHTLARPLPFSFQFSY